MAIGVAQVRDGEKKMGAETREVPSKGRLGLRSHTGFGDYTENLEICRILNSQKNGGETKGFCSQT